MNRIEDVGRTLCVRVVVARIEDIRCGKHLFDTEPTRSPLTAHPIVRDPPPRVKRHPKTNAFFPHNQRLEPHLGGFGIDGVEMFQQRDRVDIFLDDPAFAPRRIDIDIGAFFATEDVGVDLKPDLRIRVFGYRRVDHRIRRKPIPHPVRERRIPCRLSDDQHPSLPIGEKSLRHIGGVVVFADLVFSDQSHRLPRRFHERLISRKIVAVEDVFEVRGSGGVVVDPHIVLYEAKRRRAIYSQAEGADEAVFEENKGATAFACQLNRFLAGAFASPAVESAATEKKMIPEMIISDFEETQCIFNKCF